MNDDQKINYLEFQQIRQQLNPDSKLKKYFSATIFTQLLSEHQSLSSSSLSSIQSTGGKISILTFFRYVMRKIWLQQARVSLSFWDSSANGYLTRLV